MLKSLRLIDQDSQVNLVVVSLIIALIHIGLRVDSISLLLLCIALAFYQIEQLMDGIRGGQSTIQLSEIQRRITELDAKVAEISLVKAFRGNSYGN